MRTLCLLLFLTATALLAQPQAQPERDVLTLNNGWVLRGTLTQNTDSVGITLADGSYFAFSRDEVLRISSEPWTDPAKPPFVYPLQRGYYGTFGLALLTGQHPFGYPMVALDLQWTSGYQFGPRLATGGGIAVNFYESGFLLPIFAEVRGDLLERRFTPHYFARAGYSLPLYRIDQEQPWGNVEPLTEDRLGARGGLMGELGLGLKMYTRGSVGWLFALSYRHQRSREVRTGWDGSVIDRHNLMNRLGFRVEMMF